MRNVQAHIKHHYQISHHVDALRKGLIAEGITKAAKLGVKEDGILFPSKIIGVADTFDSMTEDCAYRTAFFAQFAMDEIKRLTGTHYEIDGKKKKKEK
ncbi:hypothetical protein ACIQD3_08100 [Peribacillus loiseleuriae]|uniref:hypothetical protein n=1 Tax=Peribacillus loiseleuriae TaxID=1679170 RepID=UPI003829E9C5